LGELDAGPMVQTIFVAILAGNGPGFSPGILASMIRIADKSHGEGSWLVAGSTLDFRDLHATGLSLSRYPSVFLDADAMLSPRL